MIIICFVPIFLMVFYGFLMKRMKVIERKMVENPNLKKYRKEEIRKIADDESLLLRDGKYYGYNPRKQEILILNKEFYSLYDMFAIYHEIGHYHDDLKNKRILKNMLVTGVNRILVIPMFFIFTVLCWIQKGNVGIHYAYSGMIILVVLLGIHRLYFIIRYEASASKDAISKLSCTIDALSLHMTKKLACYAVLSQMLFVIICMIAGGVMVDSVLFASMN